MRVKAIILRKPVFMEDEGAYHLVRQCETVEDAFKWVSEQDNEFYRPDDYLVKEV